MTSSASTIDTSGSVLGGKADGESLSGDPSRISGSTPIATMLSAGEIFMEEVRGVVIVSPVISPLAVLPVVKSSMSLVRRLSLEGGSEKREKKVKR